MATAPAPASDARSPREGSGEMFDAIASRYDLLNRILSLGIDQGWRRKAVRSLELPGTYRALDLATGTADLALLIARTHPGGELVGVDPSREMLEIGRRKVRAAGLESRITLKSGTAEAIPAEDGTFDGVSIAFGIRNVPDRRQGLREMVRVTRPGGRVAILELSEPRSGLMGPLARFHVHKMVPFVGGLLSGSREYAYLQRSIAAFPPPEEFCRMMADEGLEEPVATALSFGVCHLYVGRVPQR